MSYDENNNTTTEGGEVIASSKIEEEHHEEVLKDSSTLPEEEGETNNNNANGDVAGAENDKNAEVGGAEETPVKADESHKHEEPQEEAKADTQPEQTNGGDNTNEESHPHEAKVLIHEEKTTVVEEEREEAAQSVDKVEVNGGDGETTTFEEVQQEERHEKETTAEVVESKTEVIIENAEPVVEKKEEEKEKEEAKEDKQESDVVAPAEGTHEEPKDDKATTSAPAKVEQDKTAPPVVEEKKEEHHEDKEEKVEKEEKEKEEHKDVAPESIETGGEKGKEKEKEVPQAAAAQAPKKLPKATPEVLARLQPLNFEVASTDGGEHDDYPVVNLLSNKRNEVHSTKESKNVNLILKYTGSDEGFVATHVVIRAPVGNFSAPVQEGLIFISKDKPSEGLLRSYDNFSKNDFMKLMQVEKAKNHPEDYFDETIPVAYFDMSYSPEQFIKLRKWRAGKYLTLKLLSSSGDKTNIDIEFVGAVGFEAANAPSETYDIGRQAVLTLGLISEPTKFTNITSRADVRIFQDCLRNGITLFMVYVNDLEPDVSAGIKSAAQKVAEDLVPDDEVAVFLTGEPSELQPFAIQSRPALGFPLEQTPMVAIYADGVKHVLSADSKVTEESMRNFLNAFKAGTLKPYLKSAKRPLNDVDPRAPGLTICTASSFEEIVFNDKADVLVHYFVDYDPVYTTLSRVLSDVSSIVTAQLDLSENDVEKEHFDTEPPLLRLYPKSNKSATVVYSGPMEGDSLLKFLHEHCEEKFDLPAKQRAFEMLHPLLIEEHKRNAEKAKEEIFNELRADPQFTEIRRLVQERPQLLAPLIEQWVQSEPFFARLILSYGEEFLALLQEPVGVSHRNISRTPDGRMQITVTPEQKAGLDALIEAGYSKEDVLEAFLECDQDIEATFKLLRLGIHPPSASAHSHGHGHAHAHGHGHSHGSQSRFSSVDEDEEEELPKRKGQRSPLSRTPMPEHPIPTKKRQKQNVRVDATSVVVGLGLLAVVGGAAYYIWKTTRQGN